MGNQEGKVKEELSPSAADVLLHNEDADINPEAFKILDEAKTVEELEEIEKVLEESANEEQEEHRTEPEENKSDEPGDDNDDNDDNDETPEGEEKDTPEDNSDDDQPPEESPEEESDKDEDSDKGESDDEIVEVNDDFIESYPDPADKKILEKMRGLKMDRKALKMLINAERMVGKREKPPVAGDEEPEPTIDIENPIPKKVPTQPEVKNPEIQKTIEKETLKLLREKSEFSDMPEDPAEIKYWLTDLNAEDPERFYRFITERDKLKNELTEVANRGLYVQKHSKEINNALLQKEVKSILNEFNEYGIEEVDDFDFTLTPDNEGYLRNEILEELMYDDEKKGLDPRVVQKVGDKYILVEGALKSKFIEKYGKAIVKKAILAGRQKDRVESFKKREEKKKQTLRSAAATSSNSSPTKRTFDELIENATDAKTVEEIARQIEQSVGIT